MKLKKSSKSSRFTKIFNGEKEAEKILLDLKKRVFKEKLKPRLAVILVGQDRASKLYIKLKIKAARKIGAKLVLYKFKDSETEEKVIQKIKDLNRDFSVHGIIVQLPLPKRFNPNRITKVISEKKDVDGFQKKSCFEPVLPSAVFLVLKSAVKTFNNKRILALVNSDFFGKVLRKFFQKKKIRINYFLKSKIFENSLSKKIKSADIIITACGVPNLIKADMIKRGVVLIDAGIVRLAGKKVVGDIKRQGLKEKASFLTPVPGGIGPITVALLLKNVYYAAKNSQVNRPNVS